MCVCVCVCFLFRVYVCMSVYSVWWDEFVFYLNMCALSLDIYIYIYIYTYRMCRCVCSSVCVFVRACVRVCVLQTRQVVLLLYVVLQQHPVTLITTRISLYCLKHWPLYEGHYHYVFKLVLTQRHTVHRSTCNMTLSIHSNVII